MSTPKDLQNRTSQSSRRRFLQHSALLGTAAAVPYFSQPRTAWGQASAAANDRPTIGIIGAGGMASGNINTAKDWVDVVAVADVDRDRREAFSQRFSEGKAETYNDYRKVLERDDIDLIHVATPDHWHTKPLVEAMLAGKDVYCEKPLTLTIDEGKLIRKIQKQTGRIVQVGTQQRSTYNLFVKAIALVQEGRLGRINRIEVAIGGAPESPAIPAVGAPGNLDWDRWLGPAPLADYRFVKNDGEANGGRDFTNCHYEFRWWYEYSGGKLTDWGAHHVDIADWALRTNGQTAGPLSIEGNATHPVDFKDGEPVQQDRYNTATQFRFVVKYSGGTEVIIADRGEDGGNGIRIEGEKGRIYVNRGKLVGAPVEELKENPLPEDAIQNAYKGLPVEHNERRAHWANFLHCVRTRQEPISDVHSHMSALNVCHLAGICARLGRPLKWDAQAEQIVGDDQAAGMLARPYREGYGIEI